MRIDVAVTTAAVKEITDIASRAEEMGGAALWVRENHKNWKKVSRATQE